MSDEALISQKDQEIQELKLRVQDLEGMLTSHRVELTRQRDQLEAAEKVGQMAKAASEIFLQQIYQARQAYQALRQALEDLAALKNKL